MNTPANTAINQDGIDAVHDQANSMINDTKETISATQEKILNDYDNFVKSLQTTLVSDDTQSSSLGTALFTANKAITDVVKSEQNPDKTYLELNKKIMDGFSNALNNNSAADLNMSILTYNQTKKYITSTRDAVNEGLTTLNNAQPAEEN